MDVALITGAGGDIGTSIALALGRRDVHIVLADRTLDLATRAAESVPGAEAVQLDLRSPASVRAVADELHERHGALRYLVNNAAVCSNHEFETIDETMWSEDVDVVLGGTIRMSQAVLPAMRAAGRGAVVNIASVNGQGYFGNDVYSAAKAGVLSLTQSLAVQYGPHGVRVNSVSPGSIATTAWKRRLEREPEIFDKAKRWYPMDRIGTPEDVADAVDFLLSDKARWITGTDLRVDGGLLAGNAGLAEDISAAHVAPPGSSQTRFSAT